MIKEALTLLLVAAFLVAALTADAVFDRYRPYTALPLRMVVVMAFAVATFVAAVKMSPP